MIFYNKFLKFENNIKKITINFFFLFYAKVFVETLESLFVGTRSKVRHKNSKTTGSKVKYVMKDTILSYFTYIYKVSKNEGTIVNWPNIISVIGIFIYICIIVTWLQF